MKRTQNEAASITARALVELAFQLFAAGYTAWPLA